MCRLQSTLSLFSKVNRKVRSSVVFSSFPFASRKAPASFAAFIRNNYIKKASLELILQKYYHINNFLGCQVLTFLSRISSLLASFFLQWHWTDTTDFRYWTKYLLATHILHCACNKFSERLRTIIIYHFFCISFIVLWGLSVIFVDLIQITFNKYRKWYY